MDDTKMNDNSKEALKCYSKGMEDALKSFVKNKNLFLFYVNVELAKAQSNVILTQSKLPEFATGGIVPANTRTGDIVTMPICKTEYFPPAGTTTIVVNIDTGKPGGDWS